MIEQTLPIPSYLSFRKPLADLQQAGRASLVHEHKRTRMRTINIFAAGEIEIEPAGVSGEWHQLSVMSAGCSTALRVCEHPLVGTTKKKMLFSFPVLQTGSFKMEAAFANGLILLIDTSNEAPPHLTMMWRSVR